MVSASRLTGVVVSLAPHVDLSGYLTMLQLTFLGTVIQESHEEHEPEATLTSGILSLLIPSIG